MFRDLYPSKKPQQRFKIRKKSTFSHFLRRPLFPASTDPKYPQNFLWALRAEAEKKSFFLDFHPKIL
jgi:hypothetical protein